MQALVERSVMKLSRIPLFGGRSLAAVMAGVCAGIAGCAGYDPGPLKPGDSEAAVVARMGPPTERVRRDGGERLVYARGPMGQHTWMVELGSDGRVGRIYQALEPARLAAVKPGMSQDDLRDQLGPPSEQRALAFEGRRLWAWRYPTYECSWFVVTLNAGGRVLDAGYMPDPRCDVEVD